MRHSTVVKVKDTTALLLIIAVIALIAGWFLNVIAMFGESFDPLTAMAVARVIGIFLAPLGGILGWL